MRTTNNNEGYGSLGDVGRVRWLYIDFNSFFASVEQQLNPKLRGKPVAVLPLMTDATCVIAASYEAKAYGIKTGTPVWEAKRLCPSIQCVPALHQNYVRVHKQIADVVENCLHINAVCSIDELACKLMGTEQIPANAFNLARHVKAALAKHVGEYIHCSIGLAPNRFLAKVAGDMQKPNGLTMLLPETLPGRLLELKPNDLPGIGRNMHIRLANAGVMSMTELWALPPKHMRAIWRSVEGERFWAMLHGYDIPERSTTRSTIGHSRVLEPELRKPEKAYEVLRKLLVKAATRLRREELSAARISFGVRWDSGLRQGDEHRFNHSQDTFLFLNALDDMWNKMCARHTPAFKKNGLIKKVSVTLYDLVPQNDVMGDLFSIPIKKPNRLKDNKTLSHALDRIHARYGADALTIGFKSKQLDQFGTKIAFTRVPELEEFGE
ncbi:MAG: impB/mucB/samB family protein [Alphaproteobacteria bacterium]|nr:impB/mucB/samB family protein [Alphaproteobacteria bacterium]